MLGLSLELGEGIGLEEGHKYPVYNFAVFHPMG